MPFETLAVPVVIDRDGFYWTTAPVVYRGKIDTVISRTVDVWLSLPVLLLALGLAAACGLQPCLGGLIKPGLFVVSLIIGLFSWPYICRIVRGQIITLKENDYVRAATAVGARWYRILARHLVPNTLGVLIIAIFLELPGVILGEAFLSFIGLGINPPNASWGSMAQEGREVYRTHTNVILIPSLAIATLVLCANFIADGLRDALDPRTKET